MGVLMYAHYSLRSTLKQVGPHRSYHMNASIVRRHDYNILREEIMMLCRNENGRSCDCYAVTHAPLLYGLTVKL